MIYLLWFKLFIMEEYKYPLRLDGIGHSFNGCYTVRYMTNYGLIKFGCGK